MSESAHTLQSRLIKAMTPDQKLLAAERLRRAAWEFKAAWIRDREPSLSEAEVQVRVRRAFLDARA